MSIITVVADYGFSQVQFAPKPAADTRQLYRIKQDAEIRDHYSRPTQLSGAPMVFRCQEHKSIRMTEAIQLFLYGLNAKIDSALARKTFADCFDTWATNDGKIRDNRNHVTGEMNSNRDPMLANLVCGGNVVMGREVELSERVGDLRAGTEALALHTLHPDNLPDVSSIQYRGFEHVIHVTTIIRQNDTLDGLCRVNPFIQMGGRAARPNQPVFYALLSRDLVYLPMWLLEKLPVGSVIPNPYHPAWDWT